MTPFIGARARRRPTRVPLPAALAAFGALAAAGCGSGSDAGVDLPSLEIHTTTAGTELDPDGYSVIVDTAPARAMGLVDSLVVDPLPAGPHTVTLAGLADNCAVSGGPTVTATVESGKTATVTYAVVCGPTHGRVVVTTATTGDSLDADGYLVQLDQAGAVPIGLNDSLPIGAVAAGDHHVTLGGVAANCSVAGDNPRTVSVTAGGQDSAAFAVTCQGPSQAASQAIAFTGNAPGVLAVFVVSPDGSGQANLTPSDLLERNPVWSPDGQRLLVTRVDPSFEAETLYVMNRDGSGRTALAGGPSVIDYRWSPNGTRVAFSLGRVVTGGQASDLWVMQADGSAMTPLATDAEGAVWSPDGSQIAYVHDTGNLHIRIIGADGAGDHRLTADSMNAIQPAWSPDGSRIAFTSLNPNQVRIIQPDGGGLLNLTQGVAQEDGAVWSPDGARLAFNSGPLADPLESEVILANADGSGRTNITNRPGFDLSPDWSPDGQHIVFARDDNGDSEIYVMNSDGSDPVDVSNRPGSFESAPDWGGQPPAAMAGPLSGVNTTVHRMVRLRVRPRQASADDR